MNSQIFPGLSESFIQQEHQRLLAEAAKARLLAEAKPKSAPRFHLFQRKPQPKPQAVPVPAPQPSVSRAVTSF